VAFVGGPESIGQVRERYQGAREVWDEFGKPAEDLIQLPTEALTVSEGRSAGERLAGLPARRRPTAAFCANDLLALGLLQHAVTAGMRVPDDLAIVGFDDIDFAAAAAVPLTSVRQPRQELGRTAARLVLDEATNPDHQHEQATFVPALVARASSGTVRR
jgi:LacI family transcriptional regulator